MCVMKHKGIVSSLAVMLLWGLLFPSVKLGYRFFGITSTGDILAFAGIRFVVCGLIIILFALARNPKDFQPAKQKLLPVLLSGLFAIILHYGFTYMGLGLTDGSKTAILKQLGAVFYICFAPLFFPEDRLSARKIAGLALGIGGILAINMVSGGLSFHIGDLLIIAASFCTVFSTVISKRIFAYVDPIVSTGVSQLFGGVVLLAVGAAAGGDCAKLIPTSWQALCVFCVIAAASVVSYCLWFTVVKKEALSKLFIIKFAEPLFASLFSWLLLGEDIFKLNYLLAFLLISAGIVMANSKKKQKDGVVSN